MDQEPDFGSLMPDTFSDLGNNSYGTAIDDYQAQMNDYDLRGPNAQFIESNASYDEEGTQGQRDCCRRLEEALELIEDLCSERPPAGTFIYRELNSTRPGGSAIRTYSWSSGYIELRDEVVTSPTDKKIQWTEVNDVRYSYDLTIATNVKAYDGPAHFIANSNIIVRNPSGTPISEINTLVTGTYTIVVDFSVNLGNKYPAPDYFPIGSFTIDQVKNPDTKEFDTVIGYKDYGCE
jgi:hypothetical protein